MNTRCDNCKGKGAIQKDGKAVGNHQPYTLTCPICNGVGHHRVPGIEYDDWEDVLAREVLAGRTLALPMAEVAAVLPEFGEAERVELNRKDAA
jgi:hypothetical protein